MFSALGRLMVLCDGLTIPLPPQYAKQTRQVLGRRGEVQTVSWEADGGGRDVEQSEAGSA